MRVIDADVHEAFLTEQALRYNGEDFTDKCMNTAYRLAIDAVHNAPTVDAVLVVHGEWKLSFDRQSGGGLVEYFECSHCNYDVGKLKPKWDYCPNCGAKMDGEREVE